MTPASLEAHVFATLAFFDLFDYPLTLSEVSRYLYQYQNLHISTSPHLHLSDLNAALSRTAEHHEGYYHLPGRAEIVRTRERRYRLAERKYRKAQRLTRFISRLPSVRLVAVCNSLAWSNADEGSDIDLFIVTAPGCVWTTRLLVVGLLKLFGLRPGEGHGDVFCASFFLSETALDLSRFALPEGDTYLAYWTATLVPLYDAGRVMAKLRRANGWLKERLPAWPTESAGRRTLGAGRGWSWLGPLLPRLEPSARRLQERLFPAEIKALLNRDSRVVATADTLKFHVIDRRAEIERKFQARLTEIQITQPVCSGS